MKKVMLSVLLISLIVTVEAVTAKEKPVVLKVGDKAPHFTGLTDEKKLWDSKKAAGTKIFVVYFYPADMTPGCTKQACAYRDAVADLDRSDVEVIGVSGDSPENHQHFRREYQLNFTLLADTEGKIATAFGVKTSPGGAIQRMLEEKEVTLERGVTAARWTFVIDHEWRIVHIDRKVRADRDAAKVLRIIEKLPGKPSADRLQDAHDSGQTTINEPLGEQ